MASTSLREQIPLRRRKILKKSFNGVVRMFIVALILTVVANWAYESLVDSLSAVDRVRHDSGTDYIAIAWLGLMLLLVLWSPLYEYLYYRSYFYDMDERNLIIRKGVIAKREITLPFSKITDVYVDQDVVDVVLGIYDLHISSPTAESGKFAHIDGLNKFGAGRLRKIILDKIHEFSPQPGN